MLAVCSFADAAHAGKTLCRPCARDPVCRFLFASVSATPAPADPVVQAGASAELIDRLRADPFTYFRFINRAWTERVCEAFADVTSPTIVRLHGDAHIEQFALTQGAWGLGDFDDSTRGPSFVDVVRFLGSIDLASRQRGWTRDRDQLWNRFFEGLPSGAVQSEFSTSRARHRP